MADHQPLLYLIAYDIRQPRRLGRVHRFLRRQGLPVQYSVFTAQLDARKLERVLGGLRAIIDARIDDVRCYPLPGRPEQIGLCRQLFPEDVLLLDGGVNLIVR